MFVGLFSMKQSASQFVNITQQLCAIQYSHYKSMIGGRPISSVWSVTFCTFLDKTIMKHFDNLWLIRFSVDTGIELCFCFENPYGFVWVVDIDLLITHRILYRMSSAVKHLFLTEIAKYRQYLALWCNICKGFHNSTRWAFFKIS